MPLWSNAHYNVGEIDVLITVHVHCTWNINFADGLWILEEHILIYSGILDCFQKFSTEIMLKPHLISTFQHVHAHSIPIYTYNDLKLYIP